VSIGGDRLAAASFDARRCGALVAAGSAAVTLAGGAPLLDAARMGARVVAEELGGLSPGKLHAGAALPIQPRRTLVAMSGGVDSAVAALLVARAGREAVAVALELWADRRRRGGVLRSAHAVRLARAVAHGMGLPHLTLDLRAAFRAGVVEPFLARHAAGETPNPCVGCNGHLRLDAMLDLARRLGAAELATGHHERRAVARGGRSGQGPDVRARGAVV
jgi:tRNA-uridine 2-sulfurtransferase